MNTNDRKFLSRFSQAIESIPFSSSGQATQTGVGAIMFEQDMRAIRPVIRDIFTGLSLQNNPFFIRGYDYHSPELLLGQFEKWIEMRKSQGWQHASERSFRPFMEEVQRLETEE